MANSYKAQVTQAVKLREAQIEAFTLRIQNVLGARIRKLIPDMEAGKVDAMEMAKRLAGLQNALMQMGLQKELARLDDLFGEELKTVKSLLSTSKVAVTYSDIDRAVVEQLVNFNTERVANTLRNYVSDVKALVMQHVVGGETLKVSDIIDTTDERLERNLGTELNTMLSGFQGTVMAGKAEELGLTLALYVGPDDQITREFCEDLLSKDPPIYEVSEILGMQNNTGGALPVIEYGGGYNCRHNWAFITEDEARGMGWSG
jgi:hypothetical protein